MMTLYQGHHSSSRNLVGLMAVLALHVAAIIAFKSGLVRQIAPDLKREIEAYFVKPLEPVATPPPAPPQLERIQPVIDPPVFILPPIDLPPEADAINIPLPAELSNAAVETDVVGSGQGPRIVEFQADSRYPLTPPYYPPECIQLLQEGLVVMMIHVTPDGRVSDARIATSSGYRKLDASAMREALRSWRFKPRMEGGRPVASWGSYKIRFKLEN